MKIKVLLLLPTNWTMWLLICNQDGLWFYISALNRHLQKFLTEPEIGSAGLPRSEGSREPSGTQSKWSDEPAQKLWAPVPSLSSSPGQEWGRGRQRPAVLILNSSPWSYDDALEKRRSHNRNNNSISIVISYSHLSSQFAGEGVFAAEKDWLLKGKHKWYFVHVK